MSTVKPETDNMLLEDIADFIMNGDFDALLSESKEESIEPVTSKEQLFTEALDFLLDTEVDDPDVKELKSLNSKTEQLKKKIVLNHRKTLKVKFFGRRK